MYCTTNVTFYCDGKPEIALPKFQSMLEDLTTWLNEEHPDITTPSSEEPLTADDVHRGFEESDFGTSA